jgi:hypothetical protein
VRDVSVRVVAFHISVASVPNVVSERAPYDQIVAGNEVMAEASEEEELATAVPTVAIDAPSDDVALATTALVLLLTVDAIPAT